MDKCEWDSLYVSYCTPDDDMSSENYMLEYDLEQKARAANKELQLRLWFSTSDLRRKQVSQKR